MTKTNNQRIAEIRDLLSEWYKDGFIHITTMANIDRVFEKAYPSEYKESVFIDDRELHKDGSKRSE